MRASISQRGLTANASKGFSRTARHKASSVVPVQLDDALYVAPSPMEPWRGAVCLETLPGEDGQHHWIQHRLCLGLHLAYASTLHDCMARRYACASTHACRTCAYFFAGVCTHGHSHLHLPDLCRISQHMHGPFAWAFHRRVPGHTHSREDQRLRLFPEPSPCSKGSPALCPVPLLFLVCPPIGPPLHLPIQAKQQFKWLIRLCMARLPCHLPPPCSHQHLTSLSPPCVPYRQRR